MARPIRALRIDIEERFGSIVDVTHQCTPWLVRRATWLLNRFNGDRVVRLCSKIWKECLTKKPLLQCCERCHAGVWLGRHTASDAHLIGTPGVIQVRTVRRLTRDQRGDELSSVHLTILLVLREILWAQNRLWTSKLFTVKSGHGHLDVRGACGLVVGIITRWRALRENRRFWWPELVHRNCAFQDLKLGRNRQVLHHRDRNLQVQQDIRALQERKECNLNLWMSNLNPTWMTLT